MTEPNPPPERLEDMEAVLHVPSPAAVGAVHHDAAPTAATGSITAPGSFEMFYAAHYPDVVRALSITLGDAQWGREAADEAMTRAFDRWSDVAGYDNPAGWAYRVGLNWARSWHRKLSRRLPWSDDPVSLPQTPDPTLDAALAALDPKYRAVVVCRYLLDWSTEETADALGIATGTVKSRLSTGLEKLRSRLVSPEES